MSVVITNARLLAAVALVAGMLALAVATAGETTDPEALIVRGSRLFLPVSINGVAAEAVLDSAAEMTIVDSALAAKLKLKLEGAETIKGSGGESRTQFASGVNLTAAGLALPNLTVAVTDLSDLSKRLVGSHVELILGREFFDAGRWWIDIDGRSIHLADCADSSQNPPYKLTSARGIESMSVKVEGVPAQADIDLGNGNEVLIGKTFAEQHGLLKPERIVEQKAGGGFGGRIDRDIIVLKTLEVGGVTFENVRAAIDTQDSAGEVNIGPSILRRFMLLIDFGQHAIWLEQRK